MSNLASVKKEDVEEILGCEITEEQFKGALECAKRKQQFIYEREHREVVLQKWYLVQLTKEYVISLAFSKLTMDLCELRRNMEKEHFTHSCKSTLSVPHIVSAPI